MLPVKRKLYRWKWWVPQLQASRHGVRALSIAKRFILQGVFKIVHTNPDDLPLRRKTVVIPRAIVIVNHNNHSVVIAMQSIVAGRKASKRIRPVNVFLVRSTSTGQKMAATVIVGSRFSIVAADQMGFLLAIHRKGNVLILSASTLA